MPRTRSDRLSRDPDTYRRMVNRTVKAAMVRNEMAYNKDLADKIGLSQTQISHRFQKGWSAYELFRIGQVLKFTEEEAARMMGST